MSVIKLLPDEEIEKIMDSVYNMTANQFEQLAIKSGFVRYTRDNILCVYCKEFAAVAL